MDVTQPKMTTPFPPADQTPLHRVPPLAPSQELAYRTKCIALKRRLAEIESNNDAIRRRIETEKQFHNKMRLNRAILLNHLKDMMETPSNKLSQPQLDKFAASGGRVAEQLGSSKKRPVKEYLLDDSSDETEGDDIPEPQERPTRFKRGNNPMSRDTAISNNLPPSIPVTAANLYQQNSLPNLAPASSFSPDVLREPAMLTSSFRVSTPAGPLQAPQIQHPYALQQPHPQVLGSSYQPSQPPHLPALGQPYASPYADSTPQPQHHPVVPPPVRPQPPFEQFTEHMRPQLELDNYPAEQIAPRIREEWATLSDENRQLWDQRYQEQMVEYELQMDQYKRDQRGNPRTSMNGGGGAFSAVNR